MNCMFLGHRDAGGEAKETVKTAIFYLDKSGSVSYNLCIKR